MTTPACSSHVVIVDDSPEIARLLAAVLRQDGYRVTTAHEVLSLEALRALAPDLIVHDLVAGDGDDEIWRLLTELRHDPLLSGAAVILCSAAARSLLNPVMVAAAQRLGVSILIKPFPLSALLQAARNALNPELANAASSPRGQADHSREATWPMANANHSG